MAHPATSPTPPARRPQSPAQLAKLAVAKRFPLGAPDKLKVMVTLAAIARYAAEPNNPSSNLRLYMAGNYYEGHHGRTSQQGMADGRLDVPLGHLFGRICRCVTPPSRWPDGEPGGLEIGAGGLAPHARSLFDAPERPAQPPKGEHFPSFVACPLWPDLGVDRGEEVERTLRRFAEEVIPRLA